MNTKQRAFEIRDMHTGIHNLWILKKGVRVKEIQRLIDSMNNMESKTDEEYLVKLNSITHTLYNLVENSFEIDYREKDDKGNYNSFEIVNKLNVPDVY